MNKKNNSKMMKIFNNKLRNNLRIKQTMKNQLLNNLN